MSKIRKLFLLLVLICIISIGFLPNHTVLAESISSSAKGMIVLEGNTNTILYESNSKARLPMASTTKIMTAILALEKCDNLDEKFEISEKAIGIEGTSIYIKSGEKLSMRELLYGLILASGNDCAVAIAERLGGEDNFVNEMNELAKSLGLNDTHFDNPHGLDSDTHYTTAYDLAVITSYGLKNPEFKKLVSTERMVIEQNDIYQARYLKHKNKLLFTDENCIGVKTGFTDNAGRCLVHAHEQNGMQIICVVLNCSDMFGECQRLTDLAMSNYMMKEFVSPYNFVSNIEILDGEKSEIGIITIKGFALPIKKSEESNYEVKYDFPSTITAPVALNEEIGEVKVLYNNEIIFQDKLITIEDVKNNDLKYLFDNIIDRWF